MATPWVIGTAAISPKYGGALIEEKQYAAVLAAKGILQNRIQAYLCIPMERGFDWIKILNCQRREQQIVRKTPRQRYPAGRFFW